MSELHSGRHLGDRRAPARRPLAHVWRARLLAAAGGLLLGVLLIVGLAILVGCSEPAPPFPAIPCDPSVMPAADDPQGLRLHSPDDDRPVCVP